MIKYSTLHKDMYSVPKTELPSHARASVTYGKRSGGDREGIGRRSGEDRVGIGKRLNYHGSLFGEVERQGD